MEKVSAPAQYQKARRHLARKDPILKQLIARVGPCTLQVDSDHFPLLVRSIVSQQISSRAAAAISTRLLALSHPRPFTPRILLQRTDDELRSAGLSAAKVRYLRDLAAKVDGGAIPLRRLAQLPDEDVIEALTQVHGIGCWTAQMFLIFSLGRLDVLPVDDLGLRAGVQREYVLGELPKKKDLENLAEPWKPYRSIATWYMWRSRGPVPQS